MTKTNQNQQTPKKRTLINCIYAIIVGLLILACAIVIATVSTRANNKIPQEVGSGNDFIDVSGKPTYVLPMEGATIAKDYSGTKLQYNDSLKQWEIHKAIDFLANENTNVFSVSEGTVTNITTDYLRGTVVEISHANGLISYYMSLAKDVSVKVGDKVSAGTLIGQASNTMTQELNTGAHLHFEMTLNGAKVDPNNYLNLGNK